MIAHSFSRLNKFTTCPLAYKLAYIDKVKVPKGEPLIFGDLVHRFMEKYVSFCVEQKVQSDVTQALAIADSLLDDPKVMQEAPLPVNRHDEFRSLCEGAARQVIVTDQVFGAEVQYAFDREFKQVDWFSKQTWFRLKVDVIEKTGDDSVLITDYKTSWKAEGDDFQFDVYAWAIMHLFPPCQSVSAKLHFLRSGIEKPTKQPYARDDLENLDKKILGLMKRIEAEKAFAPTPGAGCEYCEFLASCTYKPTGLKAAKTPEEAAAIAADIIHEEAKLAAQKKALQAYNNLHGFVEAGGLSFGYHVSEAVKFKEIAKFISACEAAGVDSGYFLSVDSRKAGKLLRDKDEKVKAAFAAIASTETSQRWGSRKIGADAE